MPAAFRKRANDIDLKAKISMRTCAELAKHLAKRRPKTPEEFEQVEYLKNFVSATAGHNEAVAGLLKYMHEFLSEVALDSQVLCDGAEFRDKLKDQSDTILIQIEESKKMMRIVKEREQAFKDKISEYERDKRG